jgi:integrase
LELFIFAHNDEWRPSTQSNYVHAVADRHRAAGLPDPSDSAAVMGLRKAIMRDKGSRPYAVKDPLLADALAGLLGVPLERRNGLGEVGSLRAQIGAVLSHGHRLVSRQIVRLERDGVRLDGDRLTLSFPPCPRGGGPALDAVTVTIWRSGAEGCLVGLFERYLPLIPPGAGDLVLSWRETPTVKPLPPFQAASPLRRAMSVAAAHAGVCWPETAGPAPVIPDADFLRLLRYCNPNYGKDLRDRTMIAVGWSAALRPGEICALDFDDVAAKPAGYEALLWESKTNRTGVPERIPVRHWPGCPPHCAACLLARWLEDGGAVPGGPLFPYAKGGSQAGRRCTPFVVRDAITRLAAAAGLEGDWSAKSLRSGFSTQMHLSGSDLDEITETTRHRSEEVPIVHYILTLAGARHQLGQEDPGPTPPSG